MFEIVLYNKLVVDQFWKTKQNSYEAFYWQSNEYINSNFQMFILNMEEHLFSLLEKIRIAFLKVP